MLLGAGLALALAWPARGGEAVSQARVQTDGAEVRCKPGAEPAVYVTQKLPRGEVVQVVRKTGDGWVEILPPKGSYSWVNTSQLRPANDKQSVWLVTAEGGPVPVLVGSPFKPGKPDVVGATLQRGAQVVAVGEARPSEDGDGQWLPIMPPGGEFRYVREKDVVALPASPASGTTTTAAHPGGAGTFAEPGQRPAGGAAPQESPAPPKDVHVGGSADIDPLLQQAQDLERAGDRLGAARLYDQLGNKYAGSNHDAAMQYYTRAAWLRQGQPPARPLNEADALYQQAQQYERAGNRAEASRAYARLGDMYRDSDYKLAMQYYNRASWLRQGQPAAPAAPAASQAKPGSVVSGQQMVGPGRVAFSRVLIEGRTTYVLLSPQEQVMAYLLPQSGVDLERYVNQNVEVIGQVLAQPDVRGQVINVARVRVMSAP
jgi:hypothetical protein